MAEGTLQALRDAYVAQDVDKERSPGKVTLSAVGSCRRRAAYRLAGQPREFVVQEGRAAAHGTAIHDWLLPRLGRALQSQHDGTVLVEHPVTATAPWGPIHGRLDLYVEGRLLDLKTVGEHGIPRVQRYGPRESHIGQLGALALGLGEAHHHVDRIEVLYLDRANGDDDVQPVDLDSSVAAAEQWMADVGRFGEDPSKAPRDERGPGLSIVCDGCEFLRACWGKDAVRGTWGAQRILRVDDAATEAAAEAYEQARLDEVDAADRKTFARAVLDGARPGQYGRLRVGWSGGWEPREVPDGKAAIALLEEQGLPVPTKRDNGRRASLSVKPVPVDTPEEE